MSATSITGISGPGEATNKGPGNNRNIVPAVAPKVIAAGSIMTDGFGDALVVFPQTIPGTDHAIVVTPTAAAPNLHVGTAYDSEGLVNLSILGGATNQLHYYVVTSVGFYFQ